MTTNEGGARPFGRGSVGRAYTERSVKKRIEALFLDNLGLILTREDIQRAAADPTTGRIPENWHQRLSELRTDDGYTILSHRDDQRLTVGEYVMATSDKRAQSNKRVRPTSDTWAAVLRRAGDACEWSEGGESCRLQSGDTDPIGGGTVKLTPDHMTPHADGAVADPEDPGQWRALCGRHQVTKKNYWDNMTGKLNVLAILQAATRQEKKAAYDMLRSFFGDV